MVKRSKGTNDTTAATLVYPPFLYLGPCSAASSSSFIHSQQITHVLSVGATPATPIDGVVYTRLSLTDSPSSSITKVSETANLLIENVASKQGKILVHCSAAVSRSPTVVVAYLMKTQGMALKEALGLVVRARPTVSPNSGFLTQLKEMERELFRKTTLEVDELPRKKSEREAMFAIEVEPLKGAPEK